MYKSLERDEYLKIDPTYFAKLPYPREGEQSGRYLEGHPSSGLETDLRKYRL